MKKNESSSRFFRSMMKLYPREFRSDFGSEMEEVFQHQRDDAEGRNGLWRLWAQAIADVFRVAPREHYDMLRQDVRFALRTMRQHARFTILTIMVLALAIGANTAIFSLVRGILLRPLPYGNGERLVVLRQKALGRGVDDMGFSIPEMADYRAQTRTLEGISEYHSMTFTLTGHGDPERVTTGVVSANFFPLLGVQPMLGHGFTPDDDRDNAPSVLMLSYNYWRQAFGGDPSVVGKTYEMNGRVHTVVGVLPPLPPVPDNNAVYMNVPSCPFRNKPMMKTDRTMHMVAAFGTLKPGVSLAQASTDLATIAGRLRQEYPKAYPEDLGFTAAASPFSFELTHTARPTLLLLLATSGFVLLIACANVANLILSRQLRREREMAVRAALGARGARLLRQLVTESAILCTIAGAVGLLLGAGLMSVLVTFAARLSPLATQIRLDPVVLGFTMFVSLATAILFGSLPAMPSRRHMWSSLTDSSGLFNIGKSRRGLRAALVTAQVAGSVILLVGAGLMVRSLVKLRQVDTGLHSERIQTMLVTLSFSTYDTNAKKALFHQQLLEKVRHEPGVSAAAMASTLPLNSEQMKDNSIRLEDRPLDHPPKYDVAVITADYFHTLDIPLVSGRTLNDADNGKPPVIMLSQSLAGKLWPGENPLGRRASFDEGKTWATVVGIAANVRQNGLKSEATDVVYLSDGEAGYGSLRLLARTTGSDPAAITRQLVRDVHSIDSNQPVSDIATLEQVRDDSIAESRLVTMLLSLFSAVALLITIAGVGGVIALSVAQRTNEIGIRMALGATRDNVRWMVLREGVTLVSAGLLIGLLGSLLATRSMTTLLFAVQPNDPPTLATSSVLLLVAAALACVIPARRATAIEPMTALRHS